MYFLISSTVNGRGVSSRPSRRTSPALTYGKPPSFLSVDTFAWRPRAHSCKNMKEPFECTASVIWEAVDRQRSTLCCRQSQLTDPLPLSDLLVGPDARSIVVPAGFSGDKGAL